MATMTQPEQATALPILVDITPADCPLTAKQCTVEECVNQDDAGAQARCNLC